ncbi:MAG TPA: tetratricopeptide repeat protein [Kofleriaceae bacterium]|nr:tetratricopeptide repeat protein [Kofleriaceae bacterium]
MSESRQVRALIEQADRARRQHNWDTAIDLLKRALAVDPEHDSAHASLALALLGARRLAGAVIEVDLALGFGPNNPFCHYAAAAVRRAERKLDDAWRHCLVAMQDDDDDVDTRVLGAGIKALQGDHQAAHTLLSEALAIDADHVDALSQLAQLELNAGNHSEALHRIEQALAADPSNVDAHIIAGYIALARNQVDEAERHARFALNQDAGERDALQLWVAIKARRNVVLGLWWRLNMFVGLRSERTQIGLLIGSFVVVRIAIILLDAYGFEDAEIMLRKVWLGFCGYTWFAPEIFNWMLKRELSNVVLRDDY